MLPLASHSKYTDGTDRQMDGRQSVTHHAFRYGRGQRNKKHNIRILPTHRQTDGVTPPVVA